MWTKVVKHLARYPSAVVTAPDSGGYPYSLRCVPEPLPAQQVLRLPVPGDVPWQPGPAGLLCHWHDDELWNQTNVVLRGTLARADGAWLFRPTQVIEGAGAGMSALRQMRDGRRAAQRYLARLGLSRPRVPWDQLHAIYARAQKR
jgi:hypothetical protein